MFCAFFLFILPFALFTLHFHTIVKGQRRMKESKEQNHHSFSFLFFSLWLLSCFLFTTLQRSQRGKGKEGKRMKWNERNEVNERETESCSCALIEAEWAVRVNEARERPKSCSRIQAIIRTQHDERLVE